MDHKFKSYNDLPPVLKDELFKRHTHAELVRDQNEIIYHERDVIEIINFVIQLMNDNYGEHSQDDTGT